MTVSREEFGKLKPVTKEDDERLIKEGKKEARKGYAAKHYLKSKEKIQAQNRQRYGDNRENILKQQKIYTAEHREEHIKYLEEHKEEIVECGQKYREEHKEEIKLKHAAYLRTEAGKVVMNRFHCKRKRNLGFLELNEHFEGSEAHHINEGSEAHHINEDSVVYIPKELNHSIPHNVFIGEGMVEINNAVVEWLIDIEELMPLPK